MLTNSWFWSFKYDPTVSHIKENTQPLRCLDSTKIKKITIFFLDIISFLLLFGCLSSGHLGCICGRGNFVVFFVVDNVVVAVADVIIINIIIVIITIIFISLLRQIVSIPNRSESRKWHKQSIGSLSLQNRLQCSTRSVQFKLFHKPSGVRDGGDRQTITQAHRRTSQFIEGGLGVFSPHSKINQLFYPFLITVVL